jgi:hypothetical protein
MTIRPLKASAVPSEVAEAFEGFWTAYPARSPNPKAPARLVFARLVAGGEPPGRLVAAAAAFAAEVARKTIAPEFVPHARTWLQQRRFEDYQAGPPTMPETAPEAPVESASHPLREPFQHLAESEFRCFIAPLAVERRGPLAVITAPTRFVADHVRGRFSGELRRALGVARVQIEVRRMVEPHA